VTARDGFASLAGDLEAIAPSFGRAREAVERLAARAREGDPGEIVRAGRRVAEAIAVGLAGDPGSGRVPAPPHARAHLRTLEAGPGRGAAAGREEAFATLAAATALLRWYAEASPETVVSVPAPAVRPARARPARLRAAAVVAGLVLLALAALALAVR
jgi:hypothetical protein